MDIIPIESGPVETIGYLAIDSSGGFAVIIDAPMDSATAFQSLIDKHNLMIRSLILTHTHWDHTADALAIRQNSGASVMVHPDDEYRILDPMKHSIFPLPFTLEAVSADEYISGGDKIKFGNTELEVIHTPGHTEGSICLVCHDEGIVFTGDTLFREGFGRTDLPGGSTEKIYESVTKNILTLPENYKIYAGHGASSTIGHEKISNPLLMMRP
ncbi:MAG: MBL fold metallo-hydrolase [Candidatus Kapaibacterium sp.]